MKDFGKGFVVGYVVTYIIVRPIFIIAGRLLLLIPKEKNEMKTQGLKYPTSFLYLPKGLLILY
jgi:hypothetical protein